MTGFKFYDEYYDIVMNNQEGEFLCNIGNNDYIAFFTTLADTGFKIVEIIHQRCYIVTKEL